MKNTKTTTTQKDQSVSIIMSYVAIGVLIAFAVIIGYNVMTYGVSAAIYTH